MPDARRALSLEKSMKRDELPSTFALARGERVSAVDESGGEFEPSLDLPLDELRALLAQHVEREQKDGAYICRPMRGKRSDANAQPWRLVPVDIDGLQADELPALKRWLDESAIAGFLYTTHSHTTKKPKVRLLLIASREITAAEHAFVHQALKQRVPFALDDCMAKPSQPIFLPAAPRSRISEAVAFEVAGAPLDIDKLLASYQHEIEEQQRERAARIEGVGGGVRQPGGLIDWCNQHLDLDELLRAHGYKRKGGGRYVAPQSKSGRAAVVVNRDAHTLISFHDPAHDPLAKPAKHGAQMVLDAFAVYCVLEHGDDFKAAFKGALEVAKSRGWTDTAQPKPAPQMKSAQPLMRKRFAPLQWCIEDLVPEGCYLLAARPKVGKSWMALQFCVAVTEGGFALSRQAKRGAVLYLALEDNERRLQARLLKHEIGKFGDIDQFFYQTECPKVGDGCEEAIEAWLQAHTDAVLVVVDSLEKIRPRRTGAVYADDYAANASLKALSDRYKVTILIVCHNKKGKAESGDPLELINASLGLAGGCDGALIIERPRGSPIAKFYVIGRDIEKEQEDGYAIKFNRDTCKWEMLGDAAALVNSNAQRSIIDAIRDAGKPLTAAQVGRATKRSREAARHTLNILVDSGALIEIDNSRPLQYDLPPMQEVAE
jgi:hypothetical protein